MTVSLVRKETVMIVTWILAIINVLVFIVLSFGGMTEDAYYMYQNGALFVPAIISDQEYYRLFTSMFMHFGFEHLLNNMLSLLVLGKYIEPLLGKVRFLIVYILSGIAGNLLSFFYELYMQDYAVSAGASGAVFGLTGALLCIVVINRGRFGSITKQRVFLMVGLSVYNGFIGSGINNAAHIGGLIVGFLLTGLLSWKLYKKRRTQSYVRVNTDDTVM